MKTCISVLLVIAVVCWRAWGVITEEYHIETKVIDLPPYTEQPVRSFGWHVGDEIGVQK